MCRAETGSQFICTVHSTGEHQYVQDSFKRECLFFALPSLFFSLDCLGITVTDLIMVVFGLTMSHYLLFLSKGCLYNRFICTFPPVP